LNNVVMDLPVKPNAAPHPLRYALMCGLKLSTTFLINKVD
jgi:hypothetical protein